MAEQKEPNHPPEDTEAPQVESLNVKQTNSFLSWCNNHKTFIELIIGIVTIGAYIWVSVDQSSKTQRAIQKADSANIFTRQSLDYTKRSLFYTIRSDSIDSINYAKESLERRNNTRKELRAYIEISECGIIDGIIRVKAIIKNSGNTPAYDIKIWTYPTLNINRINQDTISRYIRDNDPIEGVPFIGAGQQVPQINSSYEALSDWSNFHIIFHIKYRNVFDEIHITQIHYSFDDMMNYFKNEKKYTFAN